MDRQLKKTPMGLNLLWLTTACADKGEHDLEKVFLTNLAKYDDRREARAAFATHANEHGRMKKALLDAETAAAGTTDEPLQIK